MRYDAIFFDFDGVLAETTTIKSEAFRTVFEDYADDVIDKVMAHHKRHEGVSRLIKIRHCFDVFIGKQLSDDELDFHGQRYSQLVEGEVVTSPWVAGAKSVLESLVGNTLTFVITGTPHEEILRVVEGRDMGGYFTSVHGSPPFKGPKVRELLAKHELSAQRCLFIGDAMTDYDAAKETGVPFLGRVAPGDPNPFPHGTKIVPDLTLFSA